MSAHDLKHRLYMFHCVRTPPGLSETVEEYVRKILPELEDGRPTDANKTPVIPANETPDQTASRERQELMRIAREEAAEARILAFRASKVRNAWLLILLSLAMMWGMGAAYYLVPELFHAFLFPSLVTAILAFVVGYFSHPGTPKIT